MSKNKEVAIEETYQKKSQLEHILLRPDTYIGSIEHAQEFMWVYNHKNKLLEQRQINFVPGLYKIFDEILVNAADNKQRDASMSSIRININPEENLIKIWNDGRGIPVAMHKKENMFVPSMIFGQLLTSSNYDDNEEKVVGGRNGYGAKLCNIFSSMFIVETASSEYKKEFKQVWRDNMGSTEEPIIKTYSGQDYTKITFSPDLRKFGMDHLDDDIVDLMCRRAFDIAASTRGVKVMLNNERVPIKNFKDYIDLLVENDKENNSAPITYKIINDRWEVGATVSEKGFQQMSFVNSIATTKGGRHVDYVADLIIKQLLEQVKKKNKSGTNLKPFQIKSHLWLFINCLIVNPTFDSQTKENMTSQPKKFGSKCEIPDDFMKSFCKSGIIEAILSWAKFKAQNELQKASGKKQCRLKGVPKLEDANEAGTKNSHKCTLILTEGDSAKCLAVSGLGVVGRDYYGVFPLRGKLLNVREATNKQILENAEINNLIKIIGLQFKKKYNTIEDVKTLRYGKVMIMTDQDQDGSHIKGLIINFIHHFWPELLQMNFLEIFITPIVKVSKRNRELSFYSLPEFEEWKSETPDYQTYSVKYYKGLGTSTSKEAKEYFSDMERHRIGLKYSGQEDDQNILLAFSKKEIEGRKDWLLRHNEILKERRELGLQEIYLYTKNTKVVTYSEYVNKELVYFSNGDNVRSIPSVMDGLKPGQRKVLFTCFKRNDKKEIKVAQLAGSVAEKSAYHHGEVSLAMTIVNLAQNFVGSNNINLLEPRGQFGTRLNGGKDSASPRYIFTKLSPLARLLFHPQDDAILAHEVDDNKKIEPVWYCPIIPMVLVNGSDGIGTGWRTKVPNYNPREIVENIKRMMRDEELKTMKPWYKNFKGTIDDCTQQRFVVNGEIAIIDEDEVEITELPVGTWTQVYKENVLEPMLYGTVKSKAVLQDYKEYSTDTTVRFVIKTLPGLLTNMEREGLHYVFKLQNIIYTSTMYLFDEFGGMKKFESAEEILKYFFNCRIKLYAKRKEYLENQLEAESQKLTYQAKFIVEKCSGKLTVENKKRQAMVEELIRREYPADPVKEWKERVMKENKETDYEEDSGENNDNTSQENSEPEENKSSDVQKYDYLLGMSMWMLTLERKNQLLKQRDDKMTELKILREKKVTDLWSEDLEEFLKKLDEVEEAEKKEDAAGKKIAKSKPGKRNIIAKEILPSPVGKRIIPRLSMHILRANKAKETKEKKILKDQAKSKTMSTTSNENDEFDLMIVDTTPLKSRVTSKLKEKPSKLTEKTKKETVTTKGRGKKKKNDDGLLQTKLTFNAKEKDSTKKISKKKTMVSDSDDSSENEIAGLTKNPPKKQRISLSDNDKDNYDDEIFKEKRPARKRTNKPLIYVPDSDEEMFEEDPSDSDEDF